MATYEVIFTKNQVRFSVYVNANDHGGAMDAAGDVIETQFGLYLWPTCDQVEVGEAYAEPEDIAN